MELIYVINNLIGSGVTKTIKVGSVAASTIPTTKVDTSTATVLEYLEFACDTENKARIFVKEKGGDAASNLVAGVSTNGSSQLSSGRPNNLIKMGNWDVIAYNTTTNEYKFRWNLNGMVFPKGLEIYVENEDTANAHNIGFMAITRSL